MMHLWGYERGDTTSRFFTYRSRVWSLLSVKSEGSLYIYKEKDNQVPFIEVELEHPDPSKPMEDEDTLMKNVLALEDHNYSSNNLSSSSVRSQDPGEDD